MDPLSPTTPAPEPASNPSKPAPARAAQDDADYQAEASPTTSSQPNKQGSQPALPRQVVIAAVVIAAVLPAILLGALFTLLMAANYNFLNWME